MLATTCGYTIGDIDRLTMDDFLMLSAYWAPYPPPHLMLRARYGIKGAGGRQQAKSNLGELLRRAGIDPIIGGRSSAMLH